MKRTIALSVLALSIVMPMRSNAQIDSDLDRVPDPYDNCRTSSNPDQVDCDGDGYGNRCDADFDQDLSPNLGEFGVFLAVFGIPASQTLGRCMGPDHDSSGTVTTADFGIFYALLFSPKYTLGPSGLACASAARGACSNHVKDGIGGSSATTDGEAGHPNQLVSPTDHSVVVFEVPPGHAGSFARIELVAGAPGGQCMDGNQCHAAATYRLVGWNDLTAAAADPTNAGGTALFDVDVTSRLTITDGFGVSDGGGLAVPPYPTSLLSFATVGAGAACPATGCVFGILADVSQVGLPFAPLNVQILGSSLAIPPYAPNPLTPLARRLCPACGLDGVATGGMGAGWVVAP